MKLLNERDSLAMTAKKLSRDLAKVITFRFKGGKHKVWYCFYFCLDNGIQIYYSYI